MTTTVTAPIVPSFGEVESGRKLGQVIVDVQSM